MAECKNCRRIIDGETLMACTGCGASICNTCAEQTKLICPYCYSDLEYFY